MAATPATMGATVLVILFLATIILLDTAGAEGVSVAGAGGGQCEEIQIPMCKEIGYNFTRLPNQFNHESQDEVSFQEQPDTTTLILIFNSCQQHKTE